MLIFNNECIFEENKLSLETKIIQKKLEVKQVEFKLGEDCWGIKTKVLMDIKVLLKDQRTVDL